MSHTVYPKLPVRRADGASSPTTAPRFQLPLLYAHAALADANRWTMCVCASVRLCVCASVRLFVCASVRLCVCASVRLLAIAWSNYDLWYDNNYTSLPECVFTRPEAVRKREHLELWYGAVCVCWSRGCHGALLHHHYCTCCRGCCIPVHSRHMADQNSVHPLDLGATMMPAG